MNATHRETVLATIRRLKEPAPTEDGLDVVQDGKLRAHLVPMTWADAENRTRVELLAQWREAANATFPTQFPVTIAGTRRWLISQLLELPDRLLFWVRALDGNLIGHVGLYRFDFDDRSAEVDNVVRGVSGVSPGIMHASLAALLDWSFGKLALEAVCLRVLSDNGRAIRLYERSGFGETMRVPLVRREEGEVVRWVEAGGDYRKPIERYFVTMRLLPAEWHAARCARAA